MQYTKQDAKYIFGTFLVLFISMILNFTISIPVGDVMVGLSVGIIFGTIFTIYRFRRYAQNTSMKILFILLTLASLSFIVPLCMYNLLYELEPQLEFVSSLLLQPEFTPEEFNNMVASMATLQNDVLLVTSIQTLATTLPTAGVLICIGYIMDDVGESCGLKATKKAKKNYVFGAVSLLMTIMFIIIVMKFAFGAITYLHMNLDGTIDQDLADEAIHSLSVVAGCSFLVLITGITYVVFFIRGMVIMNRAAKELETPNYHQDNHSDYVDNDPNDNQE